MPTIDSTQIVSNIASGTNSQLASFSPLFIFLGGILLAFVVITFIIRLLAPSVDLFDEDGPDIL